MKLEKLRELQKEIERLEKAKSSIPENHKRRGTLIKAIEISKAELLKKIKAIRGQQPRRIAERTEAELAAFWMGP